MASLRGETVVRARATKTHGGLSVVPETAQEQKAPTVLPCVTWRGTGGAGRPSAVRDRLGHPWGQEGGTHITAGVLETTAAAVIFHKKRLYWGRPRDRSRERGFTRGWTASVWSPGTRPRVQASGAGGPKGTGLRPRRMGRGGWGWGAPAPAPLLGHSPGVFPVEAAPPHCLPPPSTGQGAELPPHLPDSSRTPGPWRSRVHLPLRLQPGSVPGMGPREKGKSR